MFEKLKAFLYTQIYINIIVSNKNTLIYIEEIYSNGTSDSSENIFESSQKNKITI